LQVLLHVVKYAVDALDEVLRAIQKQLDEDEAKAFKKLRKRWLKSKDQLDVEAWLARHEWRHRFPKLRERLDWIQDLRSWFDRQYEKPAREALLKLIERARASAQEPLNRLAGT
jgi:transposase